jgi:hypothetical protein
VRPTTILSLIAGIIIALCAVLIGILAFVDRDGGKPWFFWAAPLLVLSFGGLMLNLTRQYWIRVGKLEVKGRPRSE